MNILLVNFSAVNQTSMLLQIHCELSKIVVFWDVALCRLADGGSRLLWNVGICPIS